MFTLSTLRHLNGRLVSAVGTTRTTRTTGTTGTSGTSGTSGTTRSIGAAGLFGAMALATSLWVGEATPAVAAESALVQPKVLIVDPSLPKAQADAQILAARRYDSFWSTGDESLEKAALAADFTDRTLPPGRVQGVAGPLAASKFVRGAVPDLHADIDQMIVSGDRVVTHLHFYGHFTGQFKDVQGKGQTVDFIATDIYRVADGRIADNWHLEDNLTFLQQIGVVSK